MAKMAAVGSQLGYFFSGVFLATLHILAGPKLKVKCELELPTAAAATKTTATQENEHSWGFMSEHAKETGSDKGLEEQQQQKEHTREGEGGKGDGDGGGTVSSCCLGRRLTKYKSGGKSSGMQ